MAKNERIEESISSWLEESAPPQLPERVLEATFERTRKSRQQVGWRGLLARLSYPDSCPRSPVPPSSWWQLRSH